MKVMEAKGEIHLTAEEHATFLFNVFGYPESWMIWSACSFISATYGRGGLPQEN